MKIGNIILWAAALFLASCSSALEKDEDMAPMFTGIVTDLEGNPIEHIQVTLDWESTEEVDTLYTSSEGIFRTPALLPATWPAILNVTLEDIDQEKNSGFYEKATETIVIFEEDFKKEQETGDNIIFEAYFRLTPATPSENNRQS